MRQQGRQRKVYQMEQGDGAISTKPPALWELLLDHGLENYSLDRIPKWI